MAALTLEMIRPEDRILSPQLAGRDTPMLPVDEFSGLVHPIIIPRDATGSLSRHHREFPEEHPLMLCDGGLAVRESTTEMTPDYLHNASPQAIHEQYSVPKSLPATEDEQTGGTVLGNAGYISPDGLDLLAPEPRIRPFTTAELERLRAPSALGLTPIHHPTRTLEHYGKWLHLRQEPVPIRDFGHVYDYLSRRLVEHIGFVNGIDRRVSEYRDTRAPEFGLQILREASHILVEATFFRGQTLAEKYSQAYVEGRLRPDAPPDAADFTLARLGARAGLDVLFGKLLEMAELDEVA